MRDTDLSALEFGAVLQLLADCAVSASGREACAAIRPATDPQQIEENSEWTWQFFRLLEEQLSLPLHEFPDIRPTLQTASHVGAVLDGPRLLEIQTTLAVSRQLAQFFRRHTQPRSLLADLPPRLPALPALEQTLRRCLDDSGGLKDEASPALRTLRLDA